MLYWENRGPKRRKCTARHRKRNSLVIARGIKARRTSARITRNNDVLRDTLGESRKRVDSSAYIPYPLADHRSSERDSNHRVSYAHLRTSLEFSCRSVGRRRSFLAHSPLFDSKRGISLSDRLKREGNSRKPIVISLELSLSKRKMNACRMSLKGYAKRVSLKPCVGNKKMARHDLAHLALKRKAYMMVSVTLLFKLYFNFNRTRVFLDFRNTEKLYEFFLDLASPAFIIPVLGKGKRLALYSHISACG